MRVLIVEDEMLVGLLIEDFVLEMGYEVVGPATRLDEALRMAENADLDFAVLDINLAGHLSFPVAEALIRRAIPFVFASGYGISGLDEKFGNVPVLQKPFEYAALKNAVEQAVAAEATV